MSSKQRRDLLRLGLIALAGAALLLLGGRGGSDATARPPTDASAPAVTVGTDDRTAALESQLARTLSAVQGAGEVTVQIAVCDLGRREYARDLSHTERSTAQENGDSSQQTTELQETQSVVQQGSAGALLLEETMPEIRGVLIVADGADSAVVQERLLRAAATLLQLSADKILVLPGENRD